MSRSASKRVCLLWQVALPLLGASCAASEPRPAPQPLAMPSGGASALAPAGPSETAPEPPASAVTSSASAAPPASAPAPTATASAVPAGPCPADMVDVQAACIDRYEAPNIAGEKPLRMQSLDDAEKFCGEHDKRLCTEDEWLRACQGPKGWSYPYGSRYDEHACNQDKPFIVPRWKALGAWPADTAKSEADRLDQSEPSGARDTCASPEGVFDLTGNVAEWVKKTHKHPEACLDAEQEKHAFVVQGCFWGKCYRKPHEPSCGYVNCSHPGGFRSYEFGFRCCRDRTP